MRRFEELEHTADIAVRVFGTTRDELFSNAAYAMAWQLAEAESVLLEIETEIEIEIGEPDAELLLVEWLSELLYRTERDGVVFIEFDVLELTTARIRAVARGGTADEYRGQIKAVTFSELQIERTQEGFATTIVFDV